MQNSHNINNLIWLDLEMTGLDVATCKILEIACIVTDKDLNIIDEAPNLIIHQSDEVLQQMDNWCTTTHTNSGLIEQVKASNINEDKAQSIMLDFVAQYAVQGKSPMCGNTIGQDRKFLDKYMPLFASYFHYRNLDVSTLKILANLWTNLAKVSKNNNHRALDDVRASIDELKYYRAHLFK